jgi:hypothetical protein
VSRGILIPALLAALTIASRLPFLTPRLAHWDAVNYALGLHDFNVAAHQPHPPGSPYYILLGRAALGLTGDDNAALILVSIVSSVGAVVGVHALASVAFPGLRAAGLVAAMLLLTQPIFWGYGTMATPWTLLAALALAIGLACVLLLRGKRELVIPSALLVGIASGFRLDATIFLSPLWAWSMCKAESDWRRRLLALASVSACVFFWLVPVAASTSGGAGGWFDRMLALIGPTDTSDEPRQLLANTFISFGTLALVVAPAVVLSLTSEPRAAMRWLRTTVNGTSGVFWLLWIAPGFVFLWLVDSTEPGHDLLFAVALCALGAGMLCASARDRSHLASRVGLLAAAQVAVFLFASPRTDQAPPWAPNSMLLNVTASGLRQQQTSLGDSLQVIRSRFDPRDSVVLTLMGQDPYRFMMYYLPDYQVLNLDPAAPIIVAARDRRQSQRQVADGCLFATSEVRHALLVVWSRSEPGLVPPEATLVSSLDEAPFQVWEVKLGSDTPDYLNFKIGGPECPLHG